MFGLVFTVYFMLTGCVNNLKCNCDKDDNVMRKDGGKLDDKDKLPVSELRFGDTGSAEEMGYYTLGALKCWDASEKKITRRCKLFRVYGLLMSSLNCAIIYNR